MRKVRTNSYSPSKKCTRDFWVLSSSLHLYMLILSLFVNLNKSVFIVESSWHQVLLCFRGFVSSVWGLSRSSSRNSTSGPNMFSYRDPSSSCQRNSLSIMDLNRSSHRPQVRTIIPVQLCTFTINEARTWTLRGTKVGWICFSWSCWPIWPTGFLDVSRCLTSSADVV